MTQSAQAGWPPLPYGPWEPTKETLHRYTQIIGKIRMALMPFRNHWWHVTLRPSIWGLTTGPMPHGEREVEIQLDLLHHRLRVLISDGQQREMALGLRPACADFYRDLITTLRELGVEVDIHPQPFDLGDSPSFAEDTVHDSYDADAVTRYWRVLSRTHQVMSQFASGFNGKASPVQLFWHSFDLAYARYSGRRAPVAAGTDPVTAEAYSHEVIAFGFWPGDSRRTPYPAFYSYTAPEPAGLTDQALDPPSAQWHDTGSGHLALLGYDDMRAAPDPAEALLAFYESAYRAGAGQAGWDTADFASQAAAEQNSGRSA